MKEDNKSPKEINETLSENTLDTVTGGKTNPFDKTQYRSMCVVCTVDSGWVTGLEAVEEWELQHTKSTQGQHGEFARVQC